MLAGDQPVSVVRGPVSDREPARGIREPGGDCDTSPRGRRLHLDKGFDARFEPWGQQAGQQLRLRAETDAEPTLSAPLSLDRNARGSAGSRQNELSSMY